MPQIGPETISVFIFCFPKQKFLLFFQIFSFRLYKWFEMPNFYPFKATKIGIKSGTFFLISFLITP